MTRCKIVPLSALDQPGIKVYPQEPTPAYDATMRATGILPNAIRLAFIVSIEGVPAEVLR